MNLKETERTWIRKIRRESERKKWLEIKPFDNSNNYKILEQSELSMTCNNALLPFENVFAKGSL